MSENTYTPEKDQPLNLDMQPFIVPEVNIKGLKISAIFYGIIALGCIVALLFRTRVLFIYQYTMLFEAMTAILLFLAIKCSLKLMRAKGEIGRIVTLPARLLKASEDDGKTSFTVEFLMPGKNEPRIFTESFNGNCVNELRKTGLNALPLSYEGKTPSDADIWLEIKVENGVLSTTNLRTTKNS